MVACGTNEPKTLGSLTYEPEAQKTEPVEELVVKPLTHEEVRQEYRALLDLFEEDALREKIERRIADVHMMEGVQRQNAGVTHSGYYSDATKAYREILEKYPDSPDNAEVLYQLSKAYDTEGQQEEALNALTQLTRRYPNYVNIAEAYFRKGDIHFSNQQYPESKEAYSQVIASANPKLALNAHYMLGWSRYKLLDFRNSIDSFSFVLNSLLVNGDNLDVLGKDEKPLVNDSISSISLALDKVGGASSIRDVPQLASQDYVWRIYTNLGDYYLSKELYEESASTYRLFVNEYPSSAKSPDLSVKLINTYLEGGFAKQSLVEKEKYVDSYGLTSNYTAQYNGIRPDIQGYLKTYLDELAGHFHSKGQLHQKELADWGKRNTVPLELDKQRELEELAISALDKAADFYTQYVDTFPGDPRVDEVTFLKAEALFSSYQYPEAITEYKKVAYQPLSAVVQDNTVNAGYAAIIAHEKQLEYLKTGRAYKSQLPQTQYAENSPEIRRWQESAVDTMLAFAEKFHTDNRSPAVLTNAAEYLFGLNRYRDAIDVSSSLIAKNTTLDKTLKKTAYGIIALSYFNLNDYQQAENNYALQRELVARDSAEYAQISERLAASIYKKAEVMIEQGEKLAAIEELLKIKQWIPASPIRVTAQYDAATLLLEAEQWSRAIVELNELKTRFPDYEYAVEYPRKLAFAYEKNEDWANAAETYLVLVADDPDAKIRQDALYLAASMHERNQNLAAANYHFEQYIQRYPQPFDDYLEAHYRLAENNKTLGNQSDFNRWLDQLIDVDKTAGAQRNERSRWLAAWANAQYGDYYASLFNQLRLTLPIVKSVPAKNQWLQEASARYQAAADYGLLEFVAMSSYKTGRLYSQFANELRGAPVPPELSAEDQVIYKTIIAEQAAPFDRLALDLHKANVERAWRGQYNEWVNNSFIEMRSLSPERFAKREVIVNYGEGVY